MIATGDELRKPKAFTLIELAVVIVVVAILAVVAIIAYNSITTNFQNRAAAADASQVEKLYQADSAARQSAVTSLNDALSGDLPESVDDVQIDPDGSITVTVNDRVCTGKRFPATPGASADGEWDCIDEGDTPALAVAYPATTFTEGSDLEELLPDLTGGVGVASYAVTAGTLPSAVTLDPASGALIGPTTRQWLPTPISIGSTGADFVRGIAPAPGGAVYAAGPSGGNFTAGASSVTGLGGSDAWLGKADKNGEWEWAIVGGSSGNDSAFGLARTPDGGAVVVGTFTGTATFGGSTLISNGGTDVFVAKANTVGAWQWAASGGGAGNDTGFVVSAAADGTILIAGQSSSGVSNYGAYSMTSAGSGDAFVAKLSSAGAWQWVAGGGSTANDGARAIAATADGGAAVAGYYFAAPTFGPDTLAFGGTTDAFVAKIDSSGTWEWARAIGDAGTSTGYGVAVLSGGGIVTTGVLGGPYTIAGTLITPTGANDAYVAKLNSTGSWLWATSISGPGTEPAQAATVTDDDSVIITGYFTGVSAQAGAFPIAAGGGNEIMVAKIDSSGSWQWARAAGGTAANEAGWGAAELSTGNYAIGFSLAGTTTFGTTSASSSDGSQDAGIAWMTPAGDWAIGGARTGMPATVTVQVTRGAETAQETVTIDAP